MELLPEIFWRVAEDWPVHPLLVLLAIVALAGAGLLLTGGRGGPAAFARKRFLTGNEREFLGRLERALPEMRVHAQVAMGALLQPAARQGRSKAETRRHWQARGRFSQKICDFVLEDRRTGEVFAIVELDDRTHDPAKDKLRDAMLRQAGYRTIRWNSRAKPERERIRAEVLGPVHAEPTVKRRGS